jgi:hypothetical protein
VFRQIETAQGPLRFAFNKRSGITGEREKGRESNRRREKGSFILFFRKNRDSLSPFLL